jgi:hypothetical protein
MTAVNWLESILRSCRMVPVETRVSDLGFP